MRNTRPELTTVHAHGSKRFRLVLGFAIAGLLVWLVSAMTAAQAMMIISVPGTSSVHFAGQTTPIGWRQLFLLLATIKSAVSTTSIRDL